MPIAISLQKLCLTLCNGVILECCPGVVLNIIFMFTNLLYKFTSIL